MPKSKKSIYSNESEQVAAILQALVTDSGFTYRALAEQTGLNKDAIQALLEGQRKLGFIEWLRLCTVLGIKPVKFLELLEYHTES